MSELYKKNTPCIRYHQIKVHMIALKGFLPLASSQVPSEASVNFSKGHQGKVSSKQKAPVGALCI